MHRLTLTCIYYVARERLQINNKMAWFRAATMSSLVVVTLLAIIVSTTEAVTVVDDGDAPSPVPAGPLNLTEILQKAAQYNAFIRLLKDTEVTSQVASLLDGGGRSDADGVTVLAPSDAAFAGLRPPGLLNRMDTQAQSQLVLFHVLPKYYSFVAFETTTNPVRTQASGPRGVDTVNVTASAGGEKRQVNVSSGMVDATLGKPIYSAYPLAVYPVDTVLLPPDLFGHGGAVKDGAEAPAPAAGKRKKQTPSSSSSPAPGTAAADDEAPAKGADDTAAAGAGARTGWTAFSGTVFALALSLLVAC